HRAVREQPVPLPPAVRADAGAAGGQGPDRAHGPGAVPAHRRAALLRDPGGPRLLLGRAGRAPARRGPGQLALAPYVRPAVVPGREVVPAAGVPAPALVAVGRHAAVVLEHAGDVQQVPGHERRVAVGEVVLGTAGAGVEVGRARARLADP